MSDALILPQFVNRYLHKAIIHIVFNIWYAKLMVARLVIYHDGILPQFHGYMGVIPSQKTLLKSFC